MQLPAVNEPIQEIPTEPQTQSVTDNQVKVIVNGKAENAGTEINSTVNGKSVAHVTVNNAVVESRLNEGLTNNNLEAIKLLQILVADKKSDIVNVALTGDIIKKLEDNAFIVSVKRDNVEYVIPSQEFTISNVAKNLGVSETALKDIEVEVRISKVDEKTIEQYNQVARANGAELVFPPISFEVVAKTTQPDGTTQEININKFSNYVERIMEIPSGIDPSKVTTGIVFNADGSYSHVPTAVFQKDGKWYAKLNSLTNSQYSIISNQVTVKSVENHWAKDAVNDMASRLVISSPEAFKPDLAITRADFAAYLVRALGLYREGVTFEDTFKDVKTQGGKNLAIMIASENGIITGYTDGTFKPDATITREEAMAMYHNAMKIVALKGSDSSRYLSYDDFSTVGKWAQSYVKEVLAAHVFNGTKGNSISPKSILTYAEAAQAIQNLLVASELINE